MSNQFVKIYLKDVAVLQGVKNHNLLFELFKYVDARGMIQLNAYLKEEIAEIIGVTTGRIDHLLREYVAKGLLKSLRKGSGGYMLNPFLFFKGREDVVDNYRKVYTKIERIEVTKVYTMDGVSTKTSLTWTDDQTGEIIELTNEPRIA